MIRQGDVERRPTVDGALRPSPAAMPRHDSPDIGQPDPGAFKIFHSVQPLEDPEQLVGKLHVKTDAVIAHENDEFVRVMGIAEEPTSLGTAGLAGGTVCIKRWLPLGIVLDFMPDK